MTMKTRKWTVDKQEGEGGSSGHFTAFSAGFWGGERERVFICGLLQWLCWCCWFWSRPGPCAGPGAPRPSSPCADAPWCRWNAERFRTSPDRRRSPGAGPSPSASQTPGSCFCSEEKNNFIFIFCNEWPLTAEKRPFQSIPEIYIELVYVGKHHMLPICWMWYRLVTVQMSQINLLIPIHQRLHILKVWKTGNYHLIKEVMIAKLIPYKNMFLQ